MGYQTKIPSCVYAGVGNIEEIGAILKQESSKKALVFTDKGMAGVGLLDKLTAVLERIDVECKMFDGLNPKPAYTDVEKAVEQMNREDGDIIIAVDDGSVMDVAKLCPLLRGSPCTVTNLPTDPLLASKQTKTTMISTACGTDSEAACNVIVAIPEEQSKKGIVNAGMIPNYIILGAQMIAGPPASTVATTGVDALAHVVECLTSKKATPLSDTYAATGAKLVFRNIEEACRNPGNTEARSSMMLGVFYGEVAITGGGATAVHALSYPLGGKYHIPHGASNATLLAHVTAFNRDACAGQLGVLCDVVYLECAALETEEKTDYMIERIVATVENTEIPIHLNASGVKMTDLDLLVDVGSKQQRLLVSSRKKLSLEDIRATYLKVLKEE